MPRFRVKPVVVPLPGRHRAPGPVPVIGIDTVPWVVADPTPFRTFTFADGHRAVVARQQSFELPPGWSRAPWIACASSDDEVYGV